MNLRIHTYTNRGGKPNNEDYLDYHADENGGVFVLADGLGGHGNGEVASKLVAQTLLSELKKEAYINAGMMREVFFNANHILLENQERLNMLSMRTTAVVLSIRENEALWGHLGDSRLYYFSGNELEGVTRDHSVSYKKFLMGEIPYRDIPDDEDRAGLLGAFGSRERCIPEILTAPQEIKRGDAFLLCSDGFWEYLFDEEILIDYLKADSPKKWADLMLLRHIARTKPSNDNYSLIAIFVE